MTQLTVRHSHARFWVAAILDVWPIRFAAFVTRFVAGLVLASSFVIATGPGTGESAPGPAAAALVWAGVIWVLGTIPRWLRFLLAQGSRPPQLIRWRRAVHL